MTFIKCSAMFLLFVRTRFVPNFDVYAVALNRDTRRPILPVVSSIATTTDFNNTVIYSNNCIGLVYWNS